MEIALGKEFISDRLNYEAGLSGEMRNGSAEQGGYSGDNIFAVTYMHYQFGGTNDLNVNTSSLDMSGINMRTPEIQNIVKKGSDYINLFRYMKNQTGLAIGSVKFNYRGNNTFTLSREYYDFDIRWNEGNTSRNWATFVAALYMVQCWIIYIPLVLSPSLLFVSPYWINFQGTVTLKP